MRLSRTARCTVPGPEAATAGREVARSPTLAQPAQLPLTRSLAYRVPRMPRTARVRVLPRLVSDGGPKTQLSSAVAGEQTVLQVRVHSRPFGSATTISAW